LECADRESATSRWDQTSHTRRIGLNLHLVSLGYADRLNEIRGISTPTPWGDDDKDERMGGTFNINAPRQQRKQQQQQQQQKTAKSGPGNVYCILWFSELSCCPLSIFVVQKDSWFVYLLHAEQSRIQEFSKVSRAGGLVLG